MYGAGLMWLVFGVLLLWGWGVPLIATLLVQICLFRRSAWRGSPRADRAKAALGAPLLRTWSGSLVPGLIACALVAVPSTWWAMRAEPR